jgi:hypothetical protein
MDRSWNGEESLIDEFSQLDLVDHVPAEESVKDGPLRVDGSCRCCRQPQKTERVWSHAITAPTGESLDEVAIGFGDRVMCLIDDQEKIGITQKLVRKSGRRARL